MRKSIPAPDLNMISGAIFIGENIMTPFELARLRGEVPDDAWYRNNGKSAIENYIERENLNYAQRFNLLKQQTRNNNNSNYIIIDKRQINKEVQKVVDELIKEINKSLK